MEPSTPSSDPAPSPPSSYGLALASLVLGILALVLSFLLVGGFLGLVGLALGVLHLARKRRPAGMARWGVALSALGLLASVGFAALYYSAYQKLTEAMQDASQSREIDFTKWEGVAAPDFSLTTLDGQTLKLSALRGRRVVLDFWATWCPPCRKEIPHFIQLFDQTSRDDLVIVGISDEDAKTLGDFVKAQSVNYPIASAKNLPSPYSDIVAIPTTFFIDRKGTIQTVAVGYHDYDDLKRNAQARDLPGEPKKAPEGPPALADASQVLHPSILWSKNIPGARALCVGDWESDGAPRVLVAAGATLHVLDLTGAETSSVPLPGAFSLIECGRNKEKGPRLLGYDNWGHDVTVVDKAGKKLWSVSAPIGVDGAHWGDLNGDGADEMIVGMNGGGGLQAWSADGKKLWAAPLGNVWNQSIVSATQDQPARVFATEAGGSVRVFDAQGRPLATLRPSPDGYYDKLAASRAADKTIQIAAINGDQMAVFDETGKILWTTSAIASNAGWRANYFAVGDIKGDGTNEWAFMDGSANLVIATMSGQKISAIPRAKDLTTFAIASPPGKPGVLITLAGATVQACTFQP
ncbi:MAG: redoxin domain-containing protein [Verrucomicrobiota bacterium]|jgi:peroxiredoxin